MEKAIDKHGDAFEKKLWNASVEKLVIRPENITDAYWKSQEQILRDEGQGRELSDYEKELLTNDIQGKQRESLEGWADYLGDEQAPYPIWFKVYAWDGMSKMGVFDKDKGEYKKRNEHTVAPYPHLNQAVLGKVYGAMEDFYHRNADGEDEEERDEVLDAMVQSGSFNKLYSKFLREQKIIPKTPERTEDVHGEWIEYLPGQEEELANAAEGTPWCVASPAVGRSYLKEGNTGYDEDDWYYDENEELWHDLSQEYWDEEAQQWEEYDREYDDGAKFILFHLKDPQSGELADNACASIRLDTDGRVAEISGLNEGQALEDALVPIVEDKVKTLPGGEEFLEAFADKKKLIELDQKMQNGEELTEADKAFLLGDIKTLDTYHKHDPRVQELIKYSFGSLDSTEIIKTMKNAEPVAVAMLYDVLELSDKVDNLVELAKIGISLETMSEDLGYQTVEDNLKDLIEAGVDVQEVLPDVLYLEDVEEYLDLGMAPEVVIKHSVVGDLVEVFKILHGHGADQELLRSYLLRCSKDRILKDYKRIKDLDLIDPEDLVVVLNSVKNGKSGREVFSDLSGIFEAASDGVNINMLIRDIKYSKPKLSDVEKAFELGVEPRILLEKDDSFRRIEYSSDINEHIEKRIGLYVEHGVSSQEVFDVLIEKNPDGEFAREPEKLVEAFRRMGYDVELHE